MKKLLVCLSLFFLPSLCLAVEQLSANDPRLKEDPTIASDSSRSVQNYIIMAGLDKLAYEFEYDRTGKGIAYLTERMVNNMVIVGTNELYARGFKKQADDILKSFERVKGSILSSYDLGDHEPWSQWLVEFYNKLELLLGKDLCEKLHLDDIWVLNYSIKVVFHPKDPRWDMLEYQKHFVPFAGVVTYWTTYIACSVITYGQGAIFLICTPIGAVCEKVMIIYIAPDLSDRIYKRANGLTL